MNWVKYVVTFIAIVVLVYFALVGMDAFTPEAFSLLAAGLVAVIFEKWPWLKKSWDELGSDTKQLVMWAFLALLVLGAFGLSCANIISAFPCTWPVGFMQAAMTFLIAIGVNQGTHALSRKFG